MISERDNTPETQHSHAWNLKIFNFSSWETLASYCGTRASQKKKEAAPNWSRLIFPEQWILKCLVFFVQLRDAACHKTSHQKGKKATGQQIAEKTWWRQTCVVGFPIHVLWVHSAVFTAWHRLCFLVSTFTPFRISVSHTNLCESIWLALPVKRSKKPQLTDWEQLKNRSHNVEKKKRTTLQIRQAKFLQAVLSERQQCFQTGAFQFSSLLLFSSTHDQICLCAFSNAHMCTCLFLNGENNVCSRFLLLFGVARKLLGL